LRTLRLKSNSLSGAVGLHTSVKVALVLAQVLLAVVTILTMHVRAQEDRVSAGKRESQSSKAKLVPGEILVRFRPGSAMAQVKTSTAATLRSLPEGRTVRVEIKYFGGSALVPGLMLARVATADTRSALQALRSRDDVLYAEPRVIR
jgi:hypothetical protein